MGGLQHARQRMEHSVYVVWRDWLSPFDFLHYAVHPCNGVLFCAGFSLAIGANDTLVHINTLIGSSRCWLSSCNLGK